MLSGLLLKTVEIKFFSSIYVPCSDRVSKTSSFAFKAWLRLWLYLTNHILIAVLACFFSLNKLFLMYYAY